MKYSKKINFIHSIHALISTDLNLIATIFLGAREHITTEQFWLLQAFLIFLAADRALRTAELDAMKGSLSVAYNISDYVMLILTTVAFTGVVYTATLDIWVLIGMSALLTVELIIAVFLNTRYRIIGKPRKKKIKQPKNKKEP